MPLTLWMAAITSIVFCGAIFGFFYAWVCSTMWGLDAADPRVAIAAMQAMNASVRNIVFFPAFFLTPVVVTLTAVAASVHGRHESARWFWASAVVYLLFGLTLTLTINVPMNEALALREVPADEGSARGIWQAYSDRWQFWNAVRTVASGAALAFAAAGALCLHRQTRAEALAAT